VFWPPETLVKLAIPKKITLGAAKMAIAGLGVHPLLFIIHGMGGLV